MKSTSDTKNLYERAGITDVAEFYRTRYVSQELMDPRYFDPLNRFDLRWSRTMWVYDNVRRGATVLDLGCGAGVLALLKRKGVKLIGVDLSQQCASAARGNGYDLTLVADLAALPFDDATFDYVVSLDVLGHIAFEEKDAVLSELRRVLKPNGTTLHGIECMDRERRKGYEAMTDEELRRFISVDGHVGMEDEAEIATRFRKFFEQVRTEPRYALTLSSEEYLKQADEYGMPLCDEDFLDYLRQFSFRERRAFDMAMGYLFERISEAGIHFPKSEFVLLKASQSELGPFYNEHRDRSDLAPARHEFKHRPSICLDYATHAAFDGGWYAAEIMPPIARWMGRRAALTFYTDAPPSRLRLNLQTHLPNLEAQPLGLEFLLNGTSLRRMRLEQYGWSEVEFDLTASRFSGADAGGRYTFEIRADRTWQPSAYLPDNRDERELSIAACNIEIFR